MAVAGARGLTLNALSPSLSKKEVFQKSHFTAFFIQFAALFTLVLLNLA